MVRGIYRSSKGNPIGLPGVEGLLVNAQLN